jgi:hypothetical protein
VQISLDRQAQESLFDLPTNDGAYSSEQLSYLQSLGARRPAIMMAFPPKAAGTFLRAAVVAATGGDVLRVVYAQSSRDAQLYLPTLMGYYLGGFCTGPMVVHVHMQAFPANISLLEALGIRPVIMLRSIADMLASYWDMLDRSTAPNQGINCTIPPDFRTMDAARKADFMVDVIAPWYAGYYATWLDYAERAGDRVCVLEYASLLTDPAGTLKRLLDHAGTPRPLSDCRKAIDTVWPDRANLRFNKGLEGRSHEYFSFAHLERIGKLLSYYPSTTSMRADLIGL